MVPSISTNRKRKHLSSPPSLCLVCLWFSKLEPEQQIINKALQRKVTMAFIFPLFN